MVSFGNNYDKYFNLLFVGVLRFYFELTMVVTASAVICLSSLLIFTNANMQSQVDISELVTGAQDEGALPRIVGPAKDFVRGSINNRPFRPGGLNSDDSLGKIYPDGACNGEWARELLHGKSAQVKPPGFKDGLDLGDLKVVLCQKDRAGQYNKILPFHPLKLLNNCCKTVIFFEGTSFEVGN